MEFETVFFFKNRGIVFLDSKTVCDRLLRHLDSVRASELLPTPKMTNACVTYTSNPTVTKPT